MEQETRIGRTVEEMTNNNVALVEDLGLKDPRLEVKEISDLSDISVHRILHNYLDMSKGSARWIPKHFSAVQRQRVSNVLESFFDLCGDNPEDNYHRGENYCSLLPFTVKESMESMELGRNGKAPPRKFRVYKKSRRR